MSSSFITIICWLHCHWAGAKSAKRREFKCISRQITQHWSTRILGNPIKGDEKTRSKTTQTRARYFFLASLINCMHQPLGWFERECPMTAETDNEWWNKETPRHDTNCWNRFRNGITAQRGRVQYRMPLEKWHFCVYVHITQKHCHTHMREPSNTSRFRLSSN